VLRGVIVRNKHSNTNTVLCRQPYTCGIRMCGRCCSPGRIRFPLLVDCITGIA
jgi:hypothetical protein